jgi:hypothetical protein
MPDIYIQPIQKLRAGITGMLWASNEFFVRELLVDVITARLCNNLVLNIMLLRRAIRRVPLLQNHRFYHFRPPYGGGRKGRLDRELVRSEVDVSSSLDFTGLEGKPFVRVEHSRINFADFLLFSSRFSACFSHNWIPRYSTVL